MAKVIFIAPIYEYYPILLHALQLQTDDDWQLLLIHDGPNASGLKGLLERIGDARVRYYESERRYNDWGHSLRAMALEIIERDPLAGQFIVVTNADNYYAPSFIDYMVRAMADGGPDEAVAAYCPMVHNHWQWNVIDSQLRHQHIDCGCVLVRREAALRVGWRSREHAADWTFIEDLLNHYGAKRFRKIPNVVFVHN